MIAIIDYDAGNLRSVEKALLSLGETPVITRDRKTILKADKVIPCRGWAPLAMPWESWSSMVWWM